MKKVTRSISVAVVRTAAGEDILRPLGQICSGDTLIRYGNAIASMPIETFVRHADLSLVSVPEAEVANGFPAE